MLSTVVQTRLRLRFDSGRWLQEYHIFRLLMLALDEISTQICLKITALVYPNLSILHEARILVSSFRLVLPFPLSLSFSNVKVNFAY